MVRDANRPIMAGACRNEKGKNSAVWEEGGA
jgi:hypothetical protein